MITRVRTWLVRKILEQAGAASVVFYEDGTVWAHIPDHGPGELAPDSVQLRAFVSLMINAESFQGEYLRFLNVIEERRAYDQGQQG